MIAYIDSNVILEIVMDQAQSTAARGLLAVADQGHLDIRLPVFSVYEIEHKLLRLRAVRKDLVQVFRRHAETIAATNPEMAAEGQHAAAAMANRFALEDEALQKAKPIVLGPLLQVCKAMPLTLSAIHRALRFAAEGATIHYQDAVIAATIVEDTASHTNPSVFITKDTDILREPLVVEALAANHCRVIGSIDGGLSYIQQNTTG